MLLALLVMPVAVAARGVASRTLAQLAGAGGCISQQATLGCTPGRGLDDARAAALSPDGTSLYAVGATPAALTAFSVDAHNGLLAQLNLSAGCLVSIDQTGCGTVRALNGAAASSSRPTGSTSTSPRRPRAPSRASRASRTARSSSSRASRAARRRRSPPAAIPRPSLAGADAIAISPDGRFVYVAGASADSIVVFSRDAATGRLQVLPGGAGCMRAARTGCTPVTGLDSPSAIAISPDGTSLYVTSSAGTLTAFQRDVAGAP